MPTANSMPFPRLHTTAVSWSRPCTDKALVAGQHWEQWNCGSLIICHQKNRVTRYTKTRNTARCPHAIPSGANQQGKFQDKLDKRHLARFTVGGQKLHFKKPSTCGTSYGPCRKPNSKLKHRCRPHRRRYLAFTGKRHNLQLTMVVTSCLVSLQFVLGAQPLKTSDLEAGPPKKLLLWTLRKCCFQCGRPGSSLQVLTPRLLQVQDCPKPVDHKQQSLDCSKEL